MTGPPGYKSRAKASLMQDAALTLENDGAFYKEYTDPANLHRGSPGDARLVICKYLRVLRCPLYQPSTDCDLEQLRRYFDARYESARDCGGDTHSTARDKTRDFMNETDDNPPWEVKSTPVKTEVVDYSLLPDGTVLVCSDGTEYMKGIHPELEHQTPRPEKGRPVTGWRESKLTPSGFSWRTWATDGACSSHAGKRLVAYRLPATIDKQPFDYTTLPDGAVLICANGNEYIKGKQSFTGHGRASESKPVFGGRADGWESWERYGVHASSPPYTLVGHRVTCAPPEPDYLALPDGTAFICRNGTTVVKGPYNGLLGYVQGNPPPGGFITWTKTSRSTIGCVHHNKDGSSYYNRDWDIVSIAPTQPDSNESTTFTTTEQSAQLTPKENIMTTIINVTTQTLINGQKIEAMQMAAIYDLIAQQEAAIEKLEAIKTKPLMLLTEIAERQAGIDKLVAYLDSQVVPKAPAKVAEATEAK